MLGSCTRGVASGRIYLGGLRPANSTLATRVPGVSKRPARTVLLFFLAEHMCLELLSSRGFIKLLSTGECQSGARTVLQLLAFTMPPPPLLPCLKFVVLGGTALNEDTMKDCAVLFSNHYGIWGDEASVPLTAGSRIKMSVRKLRAEVLPDPTNGFVSLCYADNTLVGQAFATRWAFDGGRVCWVTQLVVSSEHRQKNIATMLLLQLAAAQPNCTAMGLASTHPASCLALTKAAHVSMLHLDLSFIQQHAKSILATSPVCYIRTARLRGSLFEKDGDPAVVSLANTEYFVDHAEPRAALEKWESRSSSEWPLGKLLSGHEFFVVVPLNPPR
ncbi:hypothetical protein L226DRAFT_559440 [Lentinus tigrinus ALCF2SS1-7]|uniref:uncharacterized protein n=1 Tax=Lentinus tigrinus ALCF2SS1-7 TaxID=1328758 RepID=UPI001165E7FB|nr:hypothetical protein L226DRAFT_559440 [Lentinus tigrinus ALCF2SS1-7]